MTLMVDCPRGCGWESGNPELDESGAPYSCYFCFNTGRVRIDELDAYQAASAKLDEGYTDPVPAPVYETEEIHY